MPTRDKLLTKKINGIFSKDLDGETVILKTEDRSCYLLNRTASYIWRLINGKNSVKDLIDSLSKEYNIKSPLAEKHAKKLLYSLKKNGLIEFPKRER